MIDYKSSRILILFQIRGPVRHGERYRKKELRCYGIIPTSHEKCDRYIEQTCTNKK